MFIQRIIGVLSLNADTFEEVEHDQNATMQAATVVIIAAVCSGIGGLIGNIIAGSGIGVSILGLVLSIVGLLVVWFFWAGATYLIGTNLFNGQADMGEMLRVVGFAFAPQFLAIIPFCGGLIGFLYSLVTLFIGVRQGLDLDNGKTAVIIVISFLIYLVFACGVGLVLGAVGGGLSAAIPQ